MTLVWLLVALAAVPVLVVPLTHVVGRRAGWAVAPAYTVIAALMIPSAATVLDGGEVTARYSWVPSLDVDLALRLDGLSLVFLAIVLVVGIVVMAYSAAYLPQGRNLGFYLWMTTFALGMAGLVLADDLVLLFLCWEITSLASFLLIANAGQGGEAGAQRTLLMTFIGGLALLVAVVIIIVTTGTTSLSEALGSDVWEDHGLLTSSVAVLVAVAGFTKAAQFPFHPWLPDAMAAATPVSAYLHAAAVVKAGIFLMLRFSEAFHAVPAWNVLLTVVGLFTAAMGGLFALTQTDLKKLMAYSTVSQLGYITAAIGIGTEKALTAALIHTVAHALFKSGLFMMVGVIDHEAGTRDIRRLPALRKAMPVSFWTVVVGTAAMAGVPPFLGFVSKEMLLGSMLTATGPAWAGPLAFVGLAIGAVLTFAYSAKIVFGAFIDGERDTEGIHEAPAPLLVPAMFPIWLGLPLGLAPFLLQLPLDRAVEAMVHHEAYELALWHGITPELVTTVLVIVAGALIVSQRTRLRPRVERQLLPWSGAGAIDGFARLSWRAGSLMTRLVAADQPARHVLMPVTVLTLLMGLGSLGVLTLTDVPVTVPDLFEPLDALVALLVLLAVIGVCRADSRVTAAVYLGGVGIAVTVQLFALGAPDVGLTQLMVEVLTVIVIMLVLRSLPVRFAHRAHARKRLPLVLGLLAGAAAGLGTWVLTGRREIAETGQYFLDEGYEVTGAHNLVNVILVEFRALDTLGELTVLGMAGVAIIAVLATVPEHTLRRSAPHRGLRPLDSDRDQRAAAALEDAQANLRPLQLLLRVLLPVLLALSAVIFWRGHNAPGGGFIAALVGAASLTLVYLARPTDRAVGTRRLHLGLVGGGVSVAILTGLLGYLSQEHSSFLAPLYTYVGSQHLSSAMIFDAGVYAAVLGLVLIALDLLGTEPVTPAFTPGPRPQPRTPRTGGLREREQVGDWTELPADEKPAAEDAESTESPETTESKEQHA
ncbi:DUF4040 family protein [Nocardioides bruguierae]|uniref:DUF4040 family protein n=1 Tax=Nocardioides bruguierae TaxID=2945102 RepID=UPI0020207342|nr:DUF4040 family protein [Nocardioides bruguierae]MCL8027445.1 DUF4040 family protein [Nocardioides bruguierae]